MANNFFESLVGMFDARSLDALVGSLGAPEQAVWQGLRSSIAALLAGLVSKSQDTGLLRRVLDLAPSAAGEMNLSQIARSASDPNSPLISAGRRILSGLFGNSESNVTAAVAGYSGLGAGTASTVMAMAAPLVMNFLGKRVREEGMTMDGLSGRLQAESSAIRNALPTGLRDLFWPAVTVGTTAPVVAQEVRKVRSTNWVPALAIALGLVAALWFLLHTRRPSVGPVTSVSTGSANRIATPAGCTLPTNLNLPDGGVESRLLSFLQNFDAKLAPTTWFTFDRLVFETGSATLRPESQAQFNNIAAILKNCPTIHLKITGYTDNLGSPDTNLRLSRNRANAVMSQLISEGVSADRLTAEGYGQEFPIADNATVEGRAKNRRVAMLVTQR